MQTDCSNDIFPSPFRVLVRKPFSPCDNCSYASVSVVYASWRRRGRCCRCCLHCLLPGTAGFCDLIPVERSLSGRVSHTAVILKIREMVRSYKKISPPHWWPVKVVGCVVGTTFVTIRPSVQNLYSIRCSHSRGRETYPCHDCGSSQGID